MRDWMQRLVWNAGKVICIVQVWRKFRFEDRRRAYYDEPPIPWNRFKSLQMVGAEHDTIHIILSTKEGM